MVERPGRRPQAFTDGGDRHRGRPMLGGDRQCRAEKVRVAEFGMAHICRIYILDICVNIGHAITAPIGGFATCLRSRRTRRRSIDCLLWRAKPSGPCGIAGCATRAEEGGRPCTRRSVIRRCGRQRRMDPPVPEPARRAQGCGNPPRSGGHARLSGQRRGCLCRAGRPSVAKRRQSGDAQPLAVQRPCTVSGRICRDEHDRGQCRGGPDRDPRTQRRRGRAVRLRAHLDRTSSGRVAFQCPTEAESGCMGTDRPHLRQIGYSATLRCARWRSISMPMRYCDGVWYVAALLALTGKSAACRNRLQLARQVAADNRRPGVRVGRRGAILARLGPRFVIRGIDADAVRTPARRTGAAIGGAPPRRHGDRATRGRGGSRGSISVGQCRGPARGGAARLHDPARAWRRRRQFPRRGRHHRGDGARLRRHRPHRGRDQHGRDLGGDAVWQRGAEAACRAAGAGRRQAGDLHHRARRRFRRHRHDDARRSAQRLLAAERAQALDHRRRRVEAASDLRPRVRRDADARAASAGSSRCATRRRGW